MKNDADAQDWGDGISPRGYQPSGREDKLLTVREVAAQLKLSEKTVLSWVRSGYLPAKRMGKSIRVSQSELTVFINRHKV